MQRYDHVHALHRAVFDHAGCTADALIVTHLFGGLEEETDLSWEFLLRQELRGAEGHGRVRIVAASMHRAVMLRLVRDIVVLEDGQRVHIGANSDATPSVLPEIGHDA